MSDRDQKIDALFRSRPKNHFLRRSIWVMVGLTILVYLTQGFSLGIGERQLRNLDRFLGEIVPRPLRGQDWDWGVFFDWGGKLMADGGWEALGATAGISILAIVLAMGLGGLLALPAARNLSAAEPFLPDPQPASAGRRRMLAAACAGARGLLIVMRAIPEYIWAFLLLSLLGLSAWPLIFALALHNGGILGRLSSEVFENLPRGPSAALRGIGAGRGQIALCDQLPRGFGRLLLYFFYRWETCIREATVLGLLGGGTLGFLIDNKRVSYWYDEMLFLILVSSGLIVICDLISLWARYALRQG